MGFRFLDKKIPQNMRLPQVLCTAAISLQANTVVMQHAVCFLTLKRRADFREGGIANSIGLGLSQKAIRYWLLPEWDPLQTYIL